MELTIAWFWLIPLIITLIDCYILYVAAIKKKFKSTFWNVLSIIVIILSITSPIKIGVNTTEIVNQQNYQIEQQKIIPEKITDTSFNEANRKVKGISKKELE